MICEICGKQFDEPYYMEPYDKVCSYECFEKKFWLMRVKDKDSPRSVVVDHTAYWIGEEKDKTFFRGFGGHKFKIQFKNGRYVESTNLWHNGEIPESFWDQLPDNAEFMK